MCVLCVEARVLAGAFAMDFFRKFGAVSSKHVYFFDSSFVGNCYMVSWTLFYMVYVTVSSATADLDWSLERPLQAVCLLDIMIKHPLCFAGGDLSTYVDPIPPSLKRKKIAKTMKVFKVRVILTGLGTGLLDTGSAEEIILAAYKSSEINA